MFKWLLLLAGLLAGAGALSSQPSQEINTPRSCRPGGSQDLAALVKRKERLERDIARSTGAKAVRKKQEALLRVLFDIECVNAKERDQVVEVLAADESTFRSAVRARNIVEVAIYYATNRNLSGSSDPSKLYGAQAENALSYGRAVVTIPTTHQPGNLELPSIWKLEREPDPRRHFILKSATPVKTDAARAEMAEKLRTSDSKAILVFVHGYNVGFPEAAMRMAQFAYDLRFKGVPLFFSWPSAAQVVSYLQDAETAQLSEGAFDQLLQDLSELPASDIYVIAHSMGSRIVSQVLKSRVEQGKSLGAVSELLLAAPDINADLFRTVIAPKLAAMQNTRTTIYASSSDLALRASKAVHGFRRVGETTGGVFSYPGFDTIDASTASVVMRAYGHSYLMDSAQVLKDIQSIVSQKLPAKQRGLAEAGTLPNLYWKLQK